MVKLRDYKPIDGHVLYHNSVVEEIDNEIRERGKAICHFDDVELGYFIRAGYTVKCIETRYDTFLIPYIKCEVTRG